MVHGKSVSQENVYGLRRKALGKDGFLHILAPKHFRRLGKRYMEDVTDEEIGSFYFNLDIASMKKSVSAAKGLLTKAEAEFEKQMKIAKETSCIPSDEEIKKIKDAIMGKAKQNLSEKESILANAEKLINEFKKTVE